MSGSMRALQRKRWANECKLAAATGYPLPKDYDEWLKEGCPTPATDARSAALPGVSAKKRKHEEMLERHRRHKREQEKKSEVAV